jgi:hypothetical protein
VLATDFVSVFFATGLAVVFVVGCAFDIVPCDVLLTECTVVFDV